MELGCVGKPPAGVISPAFRCRLPPPAVVLLLAEDIGGFITLTVYKLIAHNLFIECDAHLIEYHKLKHF